MRRTVSDYVANPQHAGSLDGAILVGEALAPGLLFVRIGFWLDAGGTVVRARFRATTCAALIAYADAACELAEQGAPLDELDAARVRNSVEGVHPVHYDRATLVAIAVQQALQSRVTREGRTP